MTEVSKWLLPITVLPVVSAVTTGGPISEKTMIRKIFDSNNAEKGFTRKLKTAW